MYTVLWTDSSVGDGWDRKRSIGEAIQLVANLLTKGVVPSDILVFDPAAESHTVVFEQI